MKRITTHAQLIEAIGAVLEYNWRDEEEDYKRHEGDKEIHIFTYMKALDKWIGDA